MDARWDILGIWGRNWGKEWGGNGHAELPDQEPVKPLKNELVQSCFPNLESGVELLPIGNWRTCRVHEVMNNNPISALPRSTG